MRRCNRGPNFCQNEPNFGRGAAINGADLAFRGGGIYLNRFAHEKESSPAKLI